MKTNSFFFQNLRQDRSQMSAVETGQMSVAGTGQTSAIETGQMSAVPESSGFARRAAVSGSTRRGLSRGEESEEGWGACTTEPSRFPSTPSFFDVFRGSKNRCKNGTQKVTNMVSKRDPKSEPKSPTWVPKGIPKWGSRKRRKMLIFSTLECGSCIINKCKI